MITSRQNRRLKDIRRLRRSKGSRGGELLLEGPHLITSALEAGVELREVLATSRFLARSEDLLRRLGSTTVLEVPAPLLDELADADAPRGIVALARAGWGEDCAVLRRRGPILFVDRIQDPGNLGALARVAEAAGAAGLCLAPGTVDPAHPRALRASAGSLLRLPLVLGAEPPSLRRHLDDLERVPPPWVLLSPHDGEDLYRADLWERLVLVVGSEGSGISPELARQAERRVHIPMAPPVESLNVAVAAGIVLFELARRRGAEGTPAAAEASHPSAGHAPRSRFGEASAAPRDRG